MGITNKISWVLSAIIVIAEIVIVIGRGNKLEDDGTTLTYMINVIKSNLIIIMLFTIPAMVVLFLPKLYKPRLPKSLTDFTPEVADKIIKSLNETILSKDDMLRLIRWSTTILRTKQSLVYVPVGMPVTVVGDLHGQFNDLLQILYDPPTDVCSTNQSDEVTEGYKTFMTSKSFTDKQIIFNGDYVDRGTHGVEVVTALMCCLCSSPQTIYLARGNHEDPSLHVFYGFGQEMTLKYGHDKIEVYEALCGFFKALPYAHVIGSSVFVVHGGLHSTEFTLNDVNNLPRGTSFLEDAHGKEEVSGLCASLLWSDPDECEGAIESFRGCGYKFGKDVTEKFLNKNNLKLIVRSHEVKPQGYEWRHDNKLLTIFSASNYSNSLNDAAIANIKIDLNKKPKVEICKLKKDASYHTSGEIPTNFLIAILSISVFVIFNIVILMIF